MSSKRIPRYPRTIQSSSSSINCLKDLMRVALNLTSSNYDTTHKTTEESMLQLQSKTERQWFTFLLIKCSQIFMPTRMRLSKSTTMQCSPISVRGRLSTPQLFFTFSQSGKSQRQGSRLTSIPCQRPMTNSQSCLMRR